MSILNPATGPLVRLSKHRFRTYDQHNIVPIFPAVLLEFCQNEFSGSVRTRLGSVLFRLLTPGEVHFIPEAAAVRCAISHFGKI